MNPELVFLAKVIQPALEKVVAFAVANGVPPGLRNALEHVPAWTHAHQVLANRIAEYTGGGAAGATGAGLILKKAAVLRSSH